MILLDTLYVVCCNFYKSREKETYKGGGLILLAAVFAMNLLLLSFVLDQFYVGELGDDFIKNTALLIIGFYLILFIPLFYLRYFKITSYDAILSKMNRMDSGKRNSYYIFSILYIILSFVVTFSFIFYKGGAVSGWW